MDDDFIHELKEWFGNTFFHFNNDTGEINWIIRISNIGSIYIFVHTDNCYLIKENTSFNVYLHLLDKDICIGNIGISISGIENVPYYLLLEIIKSISIYTKEQEVYCD